MVFSARIDGQRDPEFKGYISNLLIEKIMSIYSWNWSYLIAVQIYKYSVMPLLIIGMIFFSLGMTQPHPSRLKGLKPINVQGISFWGQYHALYGITWTLIGMRTFKTVRDETMCHFQRDNIMPIISWDERYSLSWMSPFLLGLRTMIVMDSYLGNFQESPRNSGQVLLTWSRMGCWRLFSRGNVSWG